MMKTCPDNRGYTLTEISICVLIIGILTVFALNYYATYKDDAERRTTQKILYQIRDAARNYWLDNGRPPEKVEQLVGKYLIKKPTSPWGDDIQIDVAKRLVYIKKPGTDRRFELSFGPEKIKDDEPSPPGESSVNTIAFWKENIIEKGSGPRGSIYDMHLIIRWNTNPVEGLDMSFEIRDGEIDSVESNGRSITDTTTWAGGNEISEDGKFFRFYSLKKGATLPDASGRLDVSLVDVPEDSGFKFKFYFVGKQIYPNPSAPEKKTYIYYSTRRVASLEAGTSGEVRIERDFNEGNTR